MSHLLSRISLDRPPRLLVSVRHADEARVALHAGVDVIDIKEPSRGSLGMADPQVIREIIESCQATTSEVLISSALGELTDWSPETIPPMDGRLTFAKLGLSRCAGTDWAGRWLQIRQQFDAQVIEGRIHWIAVIYADQINARSPEALDIIAAAAETGCAGVLVDTWSKSRGSLLDFASISELDKWLTIAHEKDLLTALAGSLTAETLVDVCSLPVDLVAVRGAACRNGDRVATICPEAIARIRKAISPKQVIQQ